ncbi:hypothetical protein FOZ63_003060, partial [Perkinsus olseni]
LAMTWSLIPGIPNWRFGAYEDPGITIYLLVVGFWYFMELPIAVLAPVFFADPAGAVVGKWASANIPGFNPPWIGKKTVLGSAAVFAVAFVSLHTPTSLLPRLLVSLVIAVAEALGSSFSTKAMMTTVSLVPDVDLPVPVGVFLMALEGVFLLVLQFDKQHISNFAARKLCHAGTGLLMLCLNSKYILNRLFIYALVVVSLTMTWELTPKLPNWRFGIYGDVGITIYLLVVGFWYYMQLPVVVLAPVFFADPAGAVVGRWATRNIPEFNPPWVGSKTVLGSAAVLIIAFFTLHSPVGLLSRVLVAVIVAMVEAIGGKYDNLCITAVVLTA